MRSGIRLRSAQRSPADRRVKAVGAGPANRPSGPGRCRRTRAASETGERAPSREFTGKVVEVADGATERLLLGVIGEHPQAGAPGDLVAVGGPVRGAQLAVGVKEGGGLVDGRRE